MSEDGELPLVRRSGKSESAFRTISEVAEDLDVPQHVLRFWESKFPQVKPLKRGGGRRYYRPEDVALLKRIRDLLYSEGYTIKGVQKLLKEGGHKEGAAAGKADELRLDLGGGDGEGDDLPPMDDAEEGGDVGDLVEAEAEKTPAQTAPVGEGKSVPRQVRRELEGILDELEQLRALLQPR